MSHSVWDLGRAGDVHGFVTQIVAPAAPEVHHVDAPSNAVHVRAVLQAALEGEPEQTVCGEGGRTVPQRTSSQPAPQAPRVRQKERPRQCGWWGNTMGVILCSFNLNISPKLSYGVLECDIITLQNYTPTIL